MKRLFLALLVLFAVNVQAAEQLIVYNWADYLPKEVLTRFTKETGIKVKYSTYDTYEVMYAKVKTLGGGGYDIVVPSTYYVDRMRKEGLLAELDKSKLPNLKNLDPKVMNQPYDPGNAYSVPYLWGSTGIAVRPDRKGIAPDIKSWSDLWRPELKRQLLLIDDVREVFMMALRVLGYSGNTRSEAEIEAAYNKLKELMPNVKVFNAESPKDAYLSGEVRVGMIWNGEAYMAQKEVKDLRFVMPTEGPSLWMDNLVIPKKAPNPEAAHKFIDFLLRPEIAKLITEDVGYTSPNLAAIALLPEKIRNNRTAYPSPEDLAKGEFQVDVGDALPLYEKYWQRLKAGK
jgi:spermidine/putrescine transport system substrate-binding protein